MVGFIISPKVMVIPLAMDPTDLKASPIFEDIRKLHYRRSRMFSDRPGGLSYVEGPGPDPNFLSLNQLSIREHCPLAEKSGHRPGGLRTQSPSWRTPRTN